MQRTGTTMRAGRIAAMRIIDSKKSDALSGCLSHIAPADQEVDYWIGEG
jgi:alanine racemase